MKKLLEQCKRPKYIVSDIQKSIAKGWWNNESTPDKYF